MSDKESIQHSIERYQALRMHEDKAFRRQLEALQRWKMKTTLACYRDAVSDEDDEELLEYYFGEVFPGVYLDELSNPGKVMKLIDKFFTGTEMLTFGLEFNSLSFEINEKLAAILFEDMKLDEINEADYVEACHRANVLADLEKQLLLFEAFAVDINETVRDKLIVASVKLAKYPARAAGFKLLYRLVADGLKSARRCEDPKALLDQIIAHERLVLNKLTERADEVFVSADFG